MLPGVTAPPPAQVLALYRSKIASGDAPPLLQLGFDDKVLDLPMPELPVHPTDALSLFAEAVSWTGWERPVWALFVCDSYLQTAPSREALGKVRRGTLAARFATGDPLVRECILASLAASDGDSWCASQSYARRHLAAMNVDTIDWDEPTIYSHVEHGPAGGDVPALLAELVGAR